MSEWKLMIVVLLALAGLIGALWAANYKKEERYKQLSVPILAIIFTFAILRFDILLSNDYVEVIFRRFPVLEGYVLVALNMIILAAFLFMKIVWKIGDKGLRWIRGKFAWTNPLVSGKNTLFVRLAQLLPDHVRKRLIVQNGKDTTVAIAYEQGIREVTLKPQWFFPRTVMLACSIIPLTLLILYIVSMTYDIVSGIRMFLPVYPVLSLILLLETVWFLGGKRPTFEKETIFGRDAHATSNASYEALYGIYQRIWPDRIATTGQMKSPSQAQLGLGTYSQKETTKEVQRQYNEITKRLHKKGIRLVPSHVEILHNILAERDVLIEDPVYADLEPFLFPAISSLLVKNKKIVLLVQDEKAAGAAVNWMYDGIQKSSGVEFLWKITTLEQAVAENIDADILVITPDALSQPRLYDFIENKEGTSTYEVVMMLEAERTLSEFAMDIHRFSLRLRDFLHKQPQFITLSQWYEGLEISVRKITKASAEDTLAKIPRTPNLYYIVWKQEGQGYFQDAILPRLTHRVLTPEATLSIVSLKYNIERMHFLHQANTPLAESMEDIIDNRDSLLEWGVSPYLIDTLRERASFYEEYWQAPLEEHGLLFIRDTNYHLVDTLTQWGSQAKKELFLHIVSPPYMLRDYLSSTFDFYLDNNRKISPLAPRLTEANWGTAYFLLERMSHAYIREEEIRSILAQANIEQQTVLDGLNAFFQRSFRTKEDFRHALEVRKENRFHSEKNVFIFVTEYKLSARLKEMIVEDLHDFIPFQTQAGTNVEQVFKGHLFQRYLPRQQHAFGGKLYLIKGINEHIGNVDISFQTLTELQPAYRQEQTFYLYPTQGKDETEKYGSFTRTLSLMEAEIDVHTFGYYSFKNGLMFNSQATYQLLNPVEREQAKRFYPNGNVLKVTLASNEVIGEKERIAFTLAFLLNELFYTLFPHSHMFVRAAAKLPTDFFQTTNEDQMLRALFPNLETEDAEEENAVALYIMEDSPLQLGIVEAVRHNWSHILEILDDYLAWVESDLEINGTFLRFGMESIPTQFALSETGQMIRHFVPSSSLRQVRLDFTERKASVQEEEDVAKVQCDFCAKTYHATEFEQLDDKRDRCYHCAQTAVNHVEELRSIYHQVRQYFVHAFDVELRRDITIQLMNAKELQELSGLPFVPTSEYNPRIVGKARMDDNRNMFIYIENGAPRIQTLITLAHEIVHVWQFDNLNMKFMTLEEIEGFASWIEVHFAEFIGERDYAMMLDKELRARNDVYGEGYRQVMERLEKQHDETTPFDFYRV